MMEDDEEVSQTIKCRLAKALQKVETLQKYEDLVIAVHKVTTTASFFLRYCFLRAFEEDPTFDMDVHFGNSPIFFVEVMKCLVEGRKLIRPSTEATATVRQTIARYFPDFAVQYPFEKPTIPGNQSNLFQYEGASLRTAYFNNIQEHLTNHLHRTVNSLLGVNEHRKDLRNKQTPEGIKVQIRLYLKRVGYLKYEVIEKKRWSEMDENVFMELEEFGLEFVETLRAISTVLQAADNGPYVKDSLSADISARPQKHLKTMFELAKVNETMSFRNFQAFPIKSSFVPSFIAVDMSVVLCHIQVANTAHALLARENPQAYWNQIFNTKSKAFQQASKQFTGFFRTDGYTLCITRGTKGDEDRSNNPKSRVRKRRRRQSIIASRKDKFVNLADVPSDELQNVEVVFIDPNRRDLLFAMHEKSTPQNPIVYRYTSMRRRKESGMKFARKRRERWIRNADPTVKESLVTLSLANKKATSIDKFNDYLLIRAQVSPILDPFFAQTMFRKLRFKRHMNQQAHEASFVNEFLEKFGKATLVWGDASIGHSKFHPPTPCVGLRDFLSRSGFKIYMLDEFKTSSMCPSCHEKVEAFKYRASPRPWRHGEETLVHGLLKCSSESCRVQGNDKLWNRDLLATLNFREIFKGYRDGNGRPDYLSR